MFLFHSGDESLNDSNGIQSVKYVNGGLSLPCTVQFSGIYKLITNSSKIFHIGSCSCTGKDTLSGREV